ncbi:uncharacterized protein LOC141855721 [Brevipalpus obovatus]|uniref:uncharacterized protein LOC141855721 n=1 Tax=Brevipalpus obovatus TaxID=246614 RepID=UPI003D9EACA9
MDLESIGSAPLIFISYQRDSQDAVLDLRRRLELAGFPCWMDVGLIGGGDSLYGKIYEGISQSQVIIACLTPRYIVSRICIREITLADVLNKPILPIMLERIKWPPPGPMAMIMSSLVFVDLCGVGGHGGVGKAADSEARLKEIVITLSRYMVSNNSPMTKSSCTHSLCGQPNDSCLELTTITSDLVTEEISLDQPSLTATHETSEQVSNYFENQNEELPEPVESEDNISVSSRLPDNHNRISNCSICTIL